MREGEGEAGGAGEAGSLGEDAGTGLFFAGVDAGPEVPGTGSPELGSLPPSPRRDDTISPALADVPGSCEAGVWLSFGGDADGVGCWLLADGEGVGAGAGLFSDDGADGGDDSGNGDAAVFVWSAVDGEAAGAGVCEAVKVGIGVGASAVLACVSA